MDKELEAIKTAIENYRHTTETWHKENVQKALDIARQMLDWLDGQYKPYKDVIGTCGVYVGLDDSSYRIWFDKYPYIVGTGVLIKKETSVLNDMELEAVKKFVIKWQYVKSEVIRALTFQNDECLKQEQRLRDKERETQELFDGFEV